MLNRRWVAIFFTVLSIVLSIVVWLMFAPVKLGGQATYVIVDGTSMEPNFHLGDLAIVREALSYQVGDIVTYHDAQLNANVIHRIIGVNQDHFILKGDNNSWIDAYQPTRDEIIGKLWIHVPNLGKAFMWLRVPLNLALTIGLLGGILMTSMMIKPLQKGKGKSGPSGNFGGALEGILYVIGFLCLAFLGLTIFTFTRPLTIADNIQYQQEGLFFYSATGTPGVYDTDTVHSGEPVFPKLTCFLNVGFAYNLLSPELQGISGSYQMYARVMDDQSGWQRTIPLIQETAFKSNSYFTMTTLDLCQIETMVNLVEQETGLHAGTYDLNIVMHMATAAMIAGSTTNDTFDPTLVFKFDKTHFFLAADSSQPDPLHFSKQGLAGGSSSQANTLPLLGWQPTVLMLRVISLLGLGLSLTALSIFGWYLFNKARQSQEALIRLKYGGLLMDVYEGSLDPTSQVIDVTSMDDLAKLAERQNTMILHMTLNFLHYYLVQNNGTTYRYVISSGRQGITATEPVQDQIANYIPNPEEKSFTQTEPDWAEIPLYKTEARENKAVETFPTHDKAVEHKIAVTKNITDKVEPTQEEITGYMVDAENNEFISDDQIPSRKENSFFINEQIDDFEEDVPVQQEMLRYVFGPYKNNNEDKETGNKK